MGSEGPVVVRSMHDFVRAFGANTAVAVYDEEDPPSAWYERLFPWASFEDGPWGHCNLWTRTGPKFGPPWDEVAVLVTPYDWALPLRVDYSTDTPTSWTDSPRPEGVRNRNLSIHVGPFALWLGRTW